MKKAKTLAWILVIAFVAVIAIAGFYIGTHDVPVLQPKGMVAQRQRDILIISSLLMLIVVLPVLIFTAIFTVRYRKENEKAKYTPEWEHSAWFEALWWGVPFIIIICLAVICYKTSHELNPFKPIDNGKKPVTVQAVALQWKWLFIYPEEGIATVNFLEIPVDRPINFEITSDAPMNSLWIPQLAGQIYAMPARRTELHLIANETGDYEGRSSNLSGHGFAGMIFTTRVAQESDYQSWVRSVRRNSKTMDVAEYKKLLVPSSYVKPEYYGRVQSGLFDRVVLQFSAPGEEL
ncbi:MAG: ubiquinol oxidase subunit II [Simkaniaceae bacterium]|nr:ubiquinol oxidase subunit II [Simkaniaceae bacterium]